MALATAVISASLSFSAWAETITDVKFEANVNLDDACNEEPTPPEFYSLDEDRYEVSGVEETTTSSSAKKDRTYKVTFSTIGDNTFPSSANSVTVNGTGVESITSKSVKDQGSTLEVKVKVYPYVQLKAPGYTENSGDDKSTSAIDSITVTNEDSAYIEYYILYTDKNGELREVHKNSTKGSTEIKIDTKSYTKIATDKEKENDKQDMEIVGFYVRATKYGGSTATNPNVVPSNWTGFGNEEPSGELINYETWGDYFENRGSSRPTQVSSQSSQSSQTVQPTQAAGPGPGSSAAATAGWTGSGNDWWWKNADGTNASGWVWDGSHYYYCDPANGGKMKAGWFLDTDGNWYYLNESHNGAYGCMLTGWQDIGGKRYYFRPNAGGPMGSMIINATVSINGVVYTFNADGTLAQ